MLSFILGIITTLLLFYLALIFESTGFATAAFSLLFVIVMAALYLIYIKKRTEGRLEFPIAITEKNSPVRLMTIIRNYSRLPIAKTVVYIEYGSNMSAKRFKTKITLEGIKPGKFKHPKLLSALAAGGYDFKITKLKLYDLTGLFHVKKKRGGSSVLTVLPELREVPVTIGESVRNFVLSAGSFDDIKTGNEAGDTYEIREFRDGDRLQTIHWKMSAKADELMVKQTHQQSACPVVLLLYPGNMSNEDTSEWAAAISFSLTDRKCPHYASWYSKTTGDIIRIRIEDEESFYLFLISYISDCAYTAPAELKDIYNDKYKSEGFMHMIIPLGDGSVIVDEDTIYADKPEELELILN